MTYFMIGPEHAIESWRHEPVHTTFDLADRMMKMHDHRSMRVGVHSSIDASHRLIEGRFATLTPKSSCPLRSESPSDSSPGDIVAWAQIGDPKPTSHPSQPNEVFVIVTRGGSVKYIHDAPRLIHAARTLMTSWYQNGEPVSADQFEPARDMTDKEVEQYSDFVHTMFRDFDTVDGLHMDTLLRGERTPAQRIREQIGLLAHQRQIDSLSLHVNDTFVRLHLEREGNDVDASLLQMVIESGGMPTVDFQKGKLTGLHAFEDLTHRLRLDYPTKKAIIEEPLYRIDATMPIIQKEFRPKPAHPTDIIAGRNLLFACMNQSN